MPSRIKVQIFPRTHVVLQFKEILIQVLFAVFFVHSSCRHFSVLVEFVLIGFEFLQSLVGSVRFAMATSDVCLSLFLH